MTHEKVNLWIVTALLAIWLLLGSIKLLLEAYPLLALLRGVRC